MYEKFILGLILIVSVCSEEIDKNVETTNSR